MSINEDIRQPKFENEHHKMLINILFSADWIDEKIKTVLDQHALTNIQYNVLRILKGAKGRPMNARDIQAVMISQKSDMTRLIDRLVKKMLVKRVVCPENRRKVDISITTEGMALLDRIHPEIKSITVEYFSAKISTAEAQTLNDLLDKIRK